MAGSAPIRLKFVIEGGKGSLDATKLVKPLQDAITKGNAQLSNDVDRLRKRISTAFDQAHTDSVKTRQKIGTEFSRLTDNIGNDFDKLAKRMNRAFKQAVNGIDLKSITRGMDDVVRSIDRVEKALGRMNSRLGRAQSGNAGSGGSGGGPGGKGNMRGIRAFMNQFSPTGEITADFDGRTLMQNIGYIGPSGAVGSLRTRNGMAVGARVRTMPQAQMYGPGNDQGAAQFYREQLRQQQMIVRQQQQQAASNTRQNALDYAEQLRKGDVDQQFQGLMSRRGFASWKSMFGGPAYAQQKLVNGNQVEVYKNAGGETMSYDRSSGKLNATLNNQSDTVARLSRAWGQAKAVIGGTFSGLNSAGNTTIGVFGLLGRSIAAPFNVIGRFNQAMLRLTGTLYVFKTFGTIFDTLLISPLHRLVSGILEATDQYREFEISILGVAGSMERAVKMNESLVRVSKNLPLTVKDLQEVAVQMAHIPTLAGRLALGSPEQAAQEVGKYATLLQKLSTLAPEQGVQGAGLAIREALAGQFRSLRFRLNVSPQQLARTIGKQLGDLARDPQLVLLAAQRYAEIFVPDEAIQRMGGLFSVRMDKIRDLIRNAAAKIGESGLYDQVADRLKTIYGELDKFIGSDKFLATAQRISDGLMSILDSLGQSFMGFLNGLTGNQGSGTFDKIGIAIAGAINGIAAVLKTLGPLAQGAGDMVRQFFDNGMVLFAEMSARAKYIYEHPAAWASGTIGSPDNNAKGEVFRATAKMMGVPELSAHAAGSRPETDAEMDARLSAAHPGFGFGRGGIQGVRGAINRWATGAKRGTVTDFKPDLNKEQEIALHAMQTAFDSVTDFGQLNPYSMIQQLKRTGAYDMMVKAFHLKTQSAFAVIDNAWEEASKKGQKDFAAAGGPVYGPPDLRPQNIASAMKRSRAARQAYAGAGKSQAAILAEQYNTASGVAMDLAGYENNPAYEINNAFGSFANLDVGGGDKLKDKGAARFLPLVRSRGAASQAAGRKQLGVSIEAYQSAYASGADQDRLDQIAQDIAATYQKMEKDAAEVSRVTGNFNDVTADWAKAIGTSLVTKFSGTLSSPSARLSLMDMVIGGTGVESQAATKIAGSTASDLNFSSRQPFDQQQILRERSQALEPAANFQALIHGYNAEKTQQILSGSLKQQIDEQQTYIDNLNKVGDKFDPTFIHLLNDANDGLADLKARLRDVALATTLANRALYQEDAKRAQGVISAGYDAKFLGPGYINNTSSKDILSQRLLTPQKIASLNAESVQGDLDNAQKTFDALQGQYKADPSAGNLKALQDQGAELLDLKNKLGEFQAEANYAFGTFKQFAAESRDALDSSLGEGINNLIMKTGTLGDAFQSLGRSIVAAFSKMVANNLLFSLIGNLGQGAQGGGFYGLGGLFGKMLTGGAQSPKIGAPAAHAMGGVMTRAHLGIVGEAGPEAIIPMRGGGIPLISSGGELFASLPGNRMVPTRMYASGGVAGGGTFVMSSRSGPNDFNYDAAPRVYNVLDPAEAFRRGYRPNRDMLNDLFAGEISKGGTRMNRAARRA